MVGPLPLATFGFSALSQEPESNPAGAKRVCVRRFFVPGPRYMKCADYRSAEQARRIKTLWAQLFATEQVGRMRRRIAAKCVDNEAGQDVLRV